MSASFRLDSTGEWDSAVVDGVEYAVLNEDDGTDEPHWDGGNRAVDIEINGDGSTLEFSQFIEGEPCGYKDIYFFDENGNQIHRDSTTSTWRSIAEECSYDNVTIVARWDMETSGRTHSFTGDRGGAHHDTRDAPGSDDFSHSSEKVLIVYDDDSVPRNWPDALESDSDVELSVTDGIEDSYCSGSRVRMSADLENNSLAGDIEGTLTITNEITGESESEDIEVSQRRGYSVSVRESIPDDTYGEGLDIFTISFRGETIYTGTADVGAESSDIEVTDVRVPDSVSSDNEFTVSVDVANAGGCNVTARVESEGEEVGSRSLRSGSDTTIRFDLTAPNVEEPEEIEYEFDLTADAKAVDDVNFSIEALPNALTLGGIDHRDAVFETEEHEIVVEVDNQTDNDLTGSVTLDSSATGEHVQDTGTVRAGGSGDVVFEDVSETLEPVEYEVTVESDGNITGQDTFSISVMELVLEITDADVPSSICRGEEYTASFTVANSADFEASGELIVESDEVGDNSFDLEGVTASSPQTVEVEYTSPTGVDVDNINYSATSEKPATGRSDSITVSTDIDDSDISITDVDAPDRSDELELEVGVEVENAGVCGVDVEVQIEDHVEDVFIGSGKTVRVEAVEELAPNDMDFDIVVTNLVTGEVEDEASHTITPLNYANVDLDEGFIEFRNGYGENVSIEGQIVAQDVEFEGNLGSEFELAGGRQGDVFDGEISGDANTVTRIEFTDLQFVNIGTDEPFAWIVDGELKERSSSFRYGTRAIFQIVPDDTLKPERAELVVVAGPLGNLGAIRQRLGLNMKLLSKPFTTSDTSDFSS